jgi:anaerobic selenocysteine-containing dehydrogenase
VVFKSKYKRISWEEAVDFIAREILRSVKEKNYGMEVSLKIGHCMVVL